MPKYTLPKTSPSEEGIVSQPYAVLYIPANKEIIESLELDEPVEVKLRGRVKSLENRESNTDADRYEFQIEIQEVDAYGENENEFAKMARED